MKRISATAEIVTALRERIQMLEEKVEELGMTVTGLCDSILASGDIPSHDFH